MSTTAQLKFFQWAQKNQPDFFDYVKDQYAEGTGGDELGFDFGSLFNTAVQAYGSYRADKLKKQELKINLERARQGADPVDFRNLPQQAGAVYQGGSIPTDWNKIVMYGVIAIAVLGGVFVFAKRGKK